MITIITSLFNAIEYIDFYLENIVKCKDYDKCEHLIFNILPSNNMYVNNVLKEYSNKYNTIKIFNVIKDIGLYNIWNIGIKKAKYDLLTTSNIDDIITYNFLTEHYNYMKQNPSINLVCSIPLISFNKIKNNEIKNYKVEWFNQKKLYFNTYNKNNFNILTGTKVKNLYYEKYPDNINNYLKIKSEFLSTESKLLSNIWVSYDYFDKYDMIEISDTLDIKPNNIPHSCPVWRKKLHIKYGFFNEQKYKKYSDYEFWFRCLKNNELFGMINKNLYIYYDNKNSHNNRNIKIEDKIILYNIISENIISENIISDNIISDNIISDNIISENIISENIISENIISENIIN